MIALYYSNGQSTGRNPVHTDSAARIRRGPRGCACWFSPLLVAKGAVCVRPFGPCGFRRNRSKRHANHSFQNRWPNDRFGEKKALVERGRLTEVDGRFLIKWFSMRSMLRENWLVLASLSAFGGDCRDFLELAIQQWVWSWLMCVMEEKVLIEVGRYVKFDRVCEGIFKDTGCDSFWRLCIIVKSQKFGYDRRRLKLMEFDCVWSWIEFCTKECGSVFWIVYFQTL